MSEPTTIALIAPGELRRIVEECMRNVLNERDDRAIEACEWMGPEDAAHLIGVSRDYLRKLKVPVHGSPRRRRYKRSEVEAFIESRDGF